MISVSTAYKAAANSNARQISAKIVIGQVEYDNDDIISIDFSGGNGEGGMSIGATISTRMVTVIKCMTPPTMTGYQIDVFAKINSSGYQQLGRYYITNVTRDNGYTTIEAYDKMYWLDKPCNFNGNKSGTVAALTWPATHQQIIDYIAAMRGFTANVTCAAFAPVPGRPIYNSEATSAEGKYYTYREIISFIAASNGCNAQFNNIGSLVFTRPGTAVETITDTDCESCSIDPSDDGFTVVGIRMVTGAGIDFYIDADESDYDEDTAGVLSCDNPLATVEIAEYVWSKLGGFKYYAAQVTRRGRGWLMPDDVINVKSDNVTYPALVGEISYSISANSGFTESITSTAESEAESSNRALDSAHSAEAAKNITNNVNVDKAIILTQEDAQTLVHNFVQTGYIAGQQIGYSSAPDDIIVQGYVVQHYQTATARYQSVLLNNVFYDASSDYSDRVIHDTVNIWAFVSVSTQNYGYLSIDNDVGWGYYSSSSALVLNDYRGFVGLNMYWTSIEPPSDDYPFGYALVNLHGVYKDQGGDMSTHGGYNNLRLPFASAAEYNAAVGLTNTPLELIKLEDYPYIVPESKLVIDNTVSKGSTNPISNAAVANALDNKADAEHTHSYDDLTDLPKINGISLTGDRAAADLELADREHSHTVSDISDMPDYLTEETDPTVPSWAKEKSKPTYTASEVGAAEQGHTHTKSQITDFPTLGTAAGKNAADFYPAKAASVLGGDYNELKTNGIFEMQGNAANPTANTPNGSHVNNNFYVQVFYRNPKYLTQIATSVRADKTQYIRSLNNGVWNNWEKIKSGDADTLDGKHASDIAADITAAVNAVEIGGRNLLYYSRFDRKYPAGWAYSAVVSYTFDGNAATLTKAETTTRQFTTQASVSNGVVAANPNLLPENGCTYTISCEIMKIEGYYIGGGTTVTVRYNYTDGMVKDFVIDVLEASETAWTKYSRTFVYSSDKELSYVQFIIALGAKACGIRIKNVKFEKGNKPTDWTPAPEDDERRIASLEARVAALEAAAVSGGEV